MRALPVLLPLLLTTALLGAEERPLASPALGLSSGRQLNPAVASDGIGFLAVWKDEKVFESAPVAMLAEHFDAAGGHGDLAVLDQRSRPPVDEPYYVATLADTPAVVWTGGVYLVAWFDSTRNTVVISRLDRDGRLIDRQPRSSGVVGSIVGAAAGAAGTVLVTSSVSGQAQGAYVLFFDANGEPAGPSHRLPDAVTPRGVSANARGFLLLFDRQTGGPPNPVSHVTSLAALSADGSIATEHPIQVGGPYALVSNGNDYLLTAGPQAATRYRLDDAGTVIGGLQKTDDTPSDANPAATAYLDGWLVALRSTSGVRGLRLDRNGAYLADVPIASTPDSSLVLASNGSVVFYAHTGGSGSRQILGHVVGVSEDAPLEPCPPGQFAASIAAGKDGAYGAVWTENPNTYDLHFTRIDSHGNTLDGSGLVFAQRGNIFGLVPTGAIGFDGANYLVAWVDPPSTATYGCDVKILHIGDDKTFPDTPVSRVIDHDCPLSLIVGSAPDRTLLVWGGSDLHLVAFDRQGKPLGPGSLIPGGYSNRDYSITWSGDRWLLVWTKASSRPLPAAYEYDVYGVRIDATGRLLDDAPFPIAAQLNQQERQPSVAAGDNEFLVAWQSAGASQPDATSIMISRIPLSGFGATDPIKIANGSNPAVVRQGNDYVLVYNDASQLWLTTASHPSIRQAITSAPDPRTDLKLVAGRGVLAALYIRNAMELPYLGTPTAFFQLLGPARRRAVRH